MAASECAIRIFSTCSAGLRSERQYLWSNSRLRLAVFSGIGRVGHELAPGRIPHAVEGGRASFAPDILEINVPEKINLAGTVLDLLRFDRGQRGSDPSGEFL